MKTVEIDGARVAYRVDGKGPGLVLVHGTGAVLARRFCFTRRSSAR